MDQEVSFFSFFLFLDLTLTLNERKQVLNVLAQEPRKGSVTSYESPALTDRQTTKSQGSSRMKYLLSRMRGQSHLWDNDAKQGILNDSNEATLALDRDIDA